MGGGTAVEMTREELRADIEGGVAAAVKRAKVPPLDDDEAAHLLDIFASQERMTGVRAGDEVVLSCDGTMSLRASRLDALADAEDVVGGDLCELAQPDYSYKAVKTVVPSEQRLMQEAQYRLTIPVQYGAQADLGRYSKPDGPCPNWSQLFGDFLSLPSTYAHMREQSQPRVMDRRVREEWAADGATDMYERARRRACEILESHEPPAIDEEVKRRMRAAVEQADRERGS